MQQKTIANCGYKSCGKQALQLCVRPRCQVNALTCNDKDCPSYAHHTHNNRSTINILQLISERLQYLRRGFYSEQISKITAEKQMIIKLFDDYISFLTQKNQYTKQLKIFTDTQDFIYGRGQKELKGEDLDQFMNDDVMKPKPNRFKQKTFSNLRNGVRELCSKYVQQHKYQYEQDQDITKIVDVYQTPQRSVNVVKQILDGKTVYNLTGMSSDTSQSTKKQKQKTKTSKQRKEKNCHSLLSYFKLKTEQTQVPDSSANLNNDNFVPHLGVRNQNRRSISSSDEGETVTKLFKVEQTDLAVGKQYFDNNNMCKKQEIQ